MRPALLLLLAICLALPVDTALATENLLINGDAETSTLLGWTRGQGVFGTTSGGPGVSGPYEGLWTFVAYGPDINSNSSDMYQHVDVGSFASCIDAGQCTYEFSGWSGTDFGDSARFEVEFRTSDYRTLARFNSGYYVTNGHWVNISASGTIPIGTRRIRVHLFGKFGGPFHYLIWAYFDAMSLSVSPGTPTHPRTWGEVKAIYR